MSVTSGTTLGVLKKAATGRGMGGDQVEASKVGRQTDFFNSLYSKDDEQTKDRQKQAQTMVSTFYDLVTDFYETGWGQSFHFACRVPTETFRESIFRHEYYMASQLNMKPTDYVLDMGCGIGGPMRNFCHFTGAKILGITINEYQVKRGNEINKKVGLSHLGKLQVTDYTKMEFSDNTFDKIFAIESTCHSPSRLTVFKEALRVLKPGGLLASYEWVTTRHYDRNNPQHVKWRQMVEKGNALPELISDKEVIEEFQKAGFELVLAEDVAETSAQKNQLPWYYSLEARCSIETLPHTAVGTYITDTLCWTMEKMGIAPKGTYEAHQILLTARKGLVEAGKLEIFTPMLLIVGRKPLK